MSVDLLKNAVDNVEKIVNEYQDNAKQSLVQEIENRLKPQSKNSENDSHKLDVFCKARIFFLIIGAVLFIAVIIATEFPPAITFPEQTGDYFAPLLTLLGFIVALSSYLATVIRGIRDVQKTSNRLRARRSIFLIALFEMSLVILSWFVILRFLAGNLEYTFSIGHTFKLDSFIFIYLSIILSLMAGLHFKVWYIHQSWRLHKK